MKNAGSLDNEVRERVMWKRTMSKALHEAVINNSNMNDEEKSSLHESICSDVWE